MNANEGIDNRPRNATERREAAWRGDVCPVCPCFPRDLRDEGTELLCETCGAAVRHLRAFAPVVRESEVA